MPLPDPSSPSPGDGDAVGPADAYWVCIRDHFFVLPVPLRLRSLQIVGLRGETLRRGLSPAAVILHVCIQLQKQRMEGGGSKKTKPL